MISVIIPSYNRAHLIGETLDSVLSQTYSNWECIVIDDHSTDKTQEVVRTYVDKDERFILMEKPENLPQGPAASRNFGFTIAKGEYINWLDSDDLMHPKKMEIDLKMIKSGNYDFTISQSKFFSDDETPLVKKFWNKNLWSNDPINDFVLKKIGWSTNSPLWKKNSLYRLKLVFNEELITAEDFIYHLKALNADLKPVIIHQDLIKQRQHPDRLNDFKKKSPFKLKVFLQLLSEEYSSQFNTSTVDHLHKLLVRQFSNLLKNKDFELAKHYRYTLRDELPDSYAREIKRLYYYGKLYRWTSKFYSKLTPILKNP